MRMKNFIIFIIFLLLPFAQLSASEIFGNISTNPQLMNNESSNSSDSRENVEDELEKQEEENKPSTIDSLGSGYIFPVNQENKEPSHAEILEDKNNKADKGVITLGISAYADGALLRGEDNKIYLIRKGFKIYISSIEKLKEYSGQIIYDVEMSELNKYQDKKYFINDLIREQGDVKVFVITDSGLKHILNLEELRLNYFGQEILNISGEEMILYE